MLLHLRAGDIETNPGPTSSNHTTSNTTHPTSSNTSLKICSVCIKPLTKQAKPIKCNKCMHLIHMRCSGLRTASKYTNEFIGPCCKNLQPAAANPQNPSQPNHRPGTIVLACHICKKTMTKAAKPIPCHKCGNHMHLRCSGLRHSKLFQPQFEGPCCKHKLDQPTSTPSTTINPQTSSYPTTSRAKSPTPPLVSTPPSPPTSRARSPTSPTTPTVHSPLPTQADNMPTQPTLDEFQILQFNCNGLSRKITEITDFMERKNIKIAAIQESKLSSRNKLTCSSNYTLIRLDRDKDAGGGIAFILHNSVKYSLLPITTTDEHTEVQGISVRSEGMDIDIINVYIPPASACKSGHSATILPFLIGSNRIIVGDLNAHHPNWFSKLNQDPLSQKRSRIQTSQ